MKNDIESLENFQFDAGSIPHACPSCGEPSSAAYFGPLVFPLLCDACNAGMEIANLAAKADEEREKREEAWEAICPKAYRETDWTRQELDPRYLAHAQSWDCRSDRGIGFQGESRKGKTRAAFAALKRSHLAGLRCYAVSFARFCDAASVSAGGSSPTMTTEQASEVVRRCYSARVLMMDDVGKGHFTERTRKEFVQLLEHRVADILPMIVTMNCTSAYLAQQLGDDYAAPALGRLNDLCEFLK